MKIDYIRVYQDSTDAKHTVSCDPDAYPTQQFIQDHLERYKEWTPRRRVVPPKPFVTEETLTENIAKLTVVYVLALCFCTVIVSALRQKPGSRITRSNDLRGYLSRPRRVPMAGTADESVALLATRSETKRASPCVIVV